MINSKEKKMLPSLFTLGRLIILRVASLREERPELLRRVGRGCWPWVIWLFHQVHPNPPPRPLSANALVSSQCRTCRLCKKNPTRLIIRHYRQRSERVSWVVEFNMSSGGLKFSLREASFFGIFCEGGSSLSLVVLLYSPLCTWAGYENT